MHPLAPNPCPTNLPKNCKTASRNVRKT
uniref:Uncharacterized protein n=1 Tax=Arundo donax TaxID=35708 RepID=A0A0A8ZZC2_ARUDO